MVEKLHHEHTMQPTGTAVTEAFTFVSGKSELQGASLDAGDRR